MALFAALQGWCAGRLQLTRAVIDDSGQHHTAGCLCAAPLQLNCVQLLCQQKVCIALLDASS